MDFLDLLLQLILQSLGPCAFAALGSVAGPWVSRLQSEEATGPARGTPCHTPLAAALGSLLASPLGPEIASLLYAKQLEALGTESWRSPAAPARLLGNAEHGAQKA